MDAPIAACFLASCVFVGGLTGAAEKLGDSIHYEGFLNDPANYHLVDNAGNPVSQEAQEP